MAKKSNFLIAICVVTMALAPRIGWPYVLPSTQIIQFMTDRYADIKALRIIQLTTVKDMDQETERTFGEIIEVMSPDLYRSEVAGQPSTRLIVHNGSKTLRIINNRTTTDMDSNDFLYRFLLLAQSPQRIQKSLQDKGINLDKVSLTRFDERVAYLIGDKDEGKPQLLVDKDHFSPLLLSYDTFSFHFSDYREIMQDTWYPYRIVYSSDGIIVEEYMVKDITVNPPVDATQFSIPFIRSRFGKTQ
jgi:outer membrane lipoprotein-sorting protein